MGADRVTNGPPSATGVNSYDTQAVVLDAQNNHLYSSGTAKQLRLLHKTAVNLAAQTALTAITTAQTLLSQAFNAGELNVIGRRLRVTLWLIYSTTSTNVATLSFALTLGGVTLCTITTAATNTAASSNLPIKVEFDLNVVSLGASATLESHGRVDANIGTAAAAAVATYLDTNTAVSAAVNLLTAPTLTVTITAGVAAVPSMQVRSATVDLAA